MTCQITSSCCIAAELVCGRCGSAALASTTETTLLCCVDRVISNPRARKVVGVHCRVAVGGGAGNWETCPDAELRPTEGFESIGHAFWFTAVTLTTVGYGDVTPFTGGGRALAIAAALSGSDALTRSPARPRRRSVPKAGDEQRSSTSIDS